MGKRLVQVDHGLFVDPDEVSSVSESIVSEGRFFNFTVKPVIQIDMKNGDFFHIDGREHFLVDIVDKIEAGREQE